MDSLVSIGYDSENLGQIGKKGIAHMCARCHLMPKDDFVWFWARDSSRKGTGRT